MAAIAAAVVFTSCNNNNEYYGPTVYRNLATVDNPDASINYSFSTDKGTRMSIASTNVFRYRPETGQRILADYSILQKAPEAAGYDYDVHLYDVYEILTKEIVAITEENAEDELERVGNDRYEAIRTWVGGDWLNFEFNLLGFNKTHYINVIEDTRVTSDDGKVYLELRHNANGDSPARRLWGMASFDLTPYKTAGKTEIDLVVSVKLPGSPDGKDFELKYKFDDPAPDNMGEINTQQEQADVQ